MIQNAREEIGSSTRANSMPDPILAASWMMMASPAARPSGGVSLDESRYPSMGHLLSSPLEVANDQGFEDDHGDLDPLETLASVLPALEQALGSWFFDQLAEDYLATRPPTLPDPFQLATGFADYLELSRPDHHLPATQREPWGDFLVELARLESYYCRACDSAWGEGPNSGEQQARSAPGSWLDRPWSEVGSWRTGLATGLELHAFCFPVDRYWRAVQHGQSPPEPEPQATWLVIQPDSGGARIQRLGASTFRALEALAQGKTFEQARRAAQAPATTFRHLLTRWIDRGWLIPWRRATLLQLAEG